MLRGSNCNFERPVLADCTRSQDAILKLFAPQAGNFRRAAVTVVVTGQVSASGLAEVSVIGVSFCWVHRQAERNTDRTGKR